MDTPVVLSHRTAWLYYHAPYRAEVHSSAADYGISEPRIPARKLARRIIRLLTDCGVPEAELGVLDVMVSMKFERTHPGPFRFHAHGSPVPAEELESIVPGLCVVREELCFLQAGVWMSALELVEYGYELCGCYEVCPWRFSDEITERERSLSRAGLAAYVEARSGLRGSRLASKSLVRVRDGAKSPMEAATAMLVVMPRKDGGLGYRGVELNRRVPVPEALRCLTRSSELEVDIYSAKERTGVEYDGEDHAEAAQRARDAERLAVLAAMDIRVNVVTKGQFHSQLSLNRAMNVAARNLGVAPDFSPEFQRAQNDLRKFLIRGWASNSR